MQLELAKTIYSLALDYDFDAEEIEIRSYAGRGTKEKTTAIVGLKMTDILRIAIENPGCFIDEYGDPIFQSATFQSDSMGLSTIIY